MGVAAIALPLMMILFPWPVSTLAGHEVANLGRHLLVVASLVVLVVAFFGGILSDAPRALLTGSAPRRDESHKPPTRLPSAAWLATDEPIRDPKDDLFSHMALVQRIVPLLEQGNPGTIALLGEQGSGKSSLLGLCMQFSESRASYKPPCVFIQLSLWPYESSEAATKASLSALSRACARLVSPGAVSGVPSRYLSATKGSGGVQAWLSAISERSPAQVLDTVEDVAVATRTRLVLWLEDYERAAPGPGASRGQSRSAMLPALLSLLADRRNLGVVVAVPADATELDLPKLTRFSEHVPAIEYEHVDVIVTHYCGKWKMISRDQGVILPGDSLESKEGRVDRESDRNVTSVSSSEIGKFVARYCRTPRVLKRVLRDALMTWERVAGEVLLEDIVLVSTFRELDIQTFRKLDDYFARLERSYSSLSSSAVQDLLEGGAFEGDDYLFGLWGQRKEPQSAFGGSSFRLRYWNRASGRVPAGRALYDQPCLAYIRDLNAGHVHRRKEQVLEPAFREALENFPGQIRDASLESLFLDVVDVFRARYLARTEETEDTDMEELWMIWRIARLKNRDLLQPVVSKTAGEAALSFWVLAESLRYLFANDESEASQALSQAGRRAVMQRIERGLERLVDAPSADIVRAAANASRHVLFRLVWGVDRIRLQTTGGFPFDFWPSFARSLLLAAKTSPGAIVPLLLPFFVVRPTADAAFAVPAVDVEQAELLFGTERILEAIAGYKNTLASDDSELEFIAMVLRGDSASDVR